MRKIKYIAFYILLASGVYFISLSSTSSYFINEDNLSLRMVRSGEVDIENVEVELIHHISRGAEFFLGTLRDFILDNPTTDNVRFFKGVKGRDREYAVAEILTSLIKELREDFSNNTEYFKRLTYSLRYLYLDPSTKDSAKRIFERIKEISNGKNILPGFITSYIDDEVVGVSEDIYLLGEERGKSLTLSKIETDANHTYLGIMDIDNLTLLNHAYGKSILDYVLDDIRRTIAVTLEEFDSFSYTNTGRDELWITLSGMENEDEAEEILNSINKRISNERYFVIELDSKTNSYISSLPSNEFERLKQVLSKQGIGISSGEYVEGEYVLILPISIRQTFLDKTDAEKFLQNFLTNVNNYLPQNGFDFKLEGKIFPFNTSLLPRVTVSIGFSSASPEYLGLSHYEDSKTIYETALKRANVALRDVKSTKEKNDVRIYSSEMEPHKDQYDLFPEEFLNEIESVSKSSDIPKSEQDDLYPGIYSNSVFRSKIQESIKEGEIGTLFWIEPTYYIEGKSIPLEFKIINELYRLGGGDLVIKALSHLLAKNIPKDLKNSVLLSRVSPDGLLIYFSNEKELGEEKQIEMVSEIVDSIKSDFDSKAKGFNIGFDVAISDTSNIDQVGRLFWQTEYTHYSKEEAKFFSTDSGNMMKVYTPGVQNEIKGIQKEMQQDALDELYLLLETEEFDEGGYFQ